MTQTPIQKVQVRLQSLGYSTRANHGPSRFTAKKDTKRLEKGTKLAAKAAVVAPAVEKKTKEKAAKSEDLPFVNTTPRGEKKGAFTWFICYRVPI